MKKRLLAILIALAVMIAIAPFYKTEASAAATTKYTNLNQVTYSSFDIIAKGSYSAVKLSGKWYYKFSYNGKVVYVAVSAFAQSSKVPSTSSINNQFTNAINNNGNNQTATYVYNSKSISYDKWVWKSKTYSKPCYTWNLSKYYLTEIFDNKSVSLACYNKGTLKLVYHSYIYNNDAKGPRAPSTAAEYKQALKRSSSNNIKKTPVFNVSIINPGKTKTYLNSYMQKAYGYTSKKGTVNAADLISLGYKTAQCGAGIVSGTGSGCASALVSASRLAISCSKKDVRKGYGWSDEKLLSGYNSTKKKNIYSYTAKYTSPLYLKSSGDYFQVKTFLKNNISYKSPKTVMKISFLLK